MSLTLDEIGKNFVAKKEYMDHATVIHAIKTIAGYCDIDKYYRQDMAVLRSCIYDELAGQIVQLPCEEVYMENDFYQN